MTEPFPGVAMSEKALLEGLQDAKATRYLCGTYPLSITGASTEASVTTTAVALTILLYDHTLTFPREIEFIRGARASFVKYTFLFNRCLVLGCMLVVSYGTFMYL